MKNQLPLWLTLVGAIACEKSESDSDPAPFTAPTPVPVVLSAAGQDQLQSAAAGPDGTFYAAGFAAAAIGGTRYVVVVKLTAAGALDTTFGDDGIVTTALVSSGGSDEVDMATQSDGKIVVTSTIPALVGKDKDIGVTRLKTDGAVDTTFGSDGVVRLDLNTGVDPGDGKDFTAPDVSRGVAIDSADRIYIHGAQRAEGNITGGATARTDTDFVVVRLTALGALDTTWGTGDTGKHLLDIYNSDTHSSATARGLAVYDDFSVVASGYATVKGISESAQPVLYRLTPDGVLDTDFAEDGVFHEVVLTTQTEIYNFAVQGENVVTAGYGRESGEKNDWVSMRFNAVTGARDLKWGDATNGAVLFDPSGAALGSNCRNAIALPGGKTMLLGSTGAGNTVEQDAVFAILNSSGYLDVAYGTGIHKFALGEDGNDQFWGGAVSGDNAIAVGFNGGMTLADQTATLNDDAYVVVIPLQ